MTFPESGWIKYINVLSSINNTAAKKFTAYLNTHDVSTKIGRKAAIDYAYAIATQYGESAAAAACEMYDAVAEASGMTLPAAEPAQTASYGDVAKAINGLEKQNQSNDVIGESIGRLVKRAGADTTLKNAKRDGAEFAWIPHGDTCAFCLMLASNGWKTASKKTVKGDHAEHIHANCDCTFAIRFDGKSSVGGYDPDKYREMYDNAEGNTWKEKLNSMRRDEYAKNADKIRAQKREKYAELHPKSAKPDIPEFVPAKTLEEAEEFAQKFIIGGKYSSVDYSGISLDYANEFNRAFNDVLSQYDPKYKLRDIKPMNMREKAFKGSTADAAYRWGSCDMFFNKSYFKTAKDFQKHLAQYRELFDTVMPNVDGLIDKYKNDSSFLGKKQLRYLQALKQTKRTNVSLARPYETIVHELGHYLDDNLFRAEFKRSGFDLSKSFAKYSTGISAYATETANEYVAESFLAYWMGEGETLDPSLVEIFERLRK